MSGAMGINYSSIECFSKQNCEKGWAGSLGYFLAAEESCRYMFFSCPLLTECGNRYKVIGWALKACMRGLQRIIYCNMAVCFQGRHGGSQGTWCDSQLFGPYLGN